MGLMMYPGSFIWKHVSDDWLASRRANQLFAFFSIVIAAMTAFLLRGVGPNFPLNVGGVLAGIGVALVWSGMWHYWVQLDSSSRAARRIWFLVLLFGVWYGAILYYVCVYLPATRRDRKRATEGLVR